MQMTTMSTMMKENESDEGSIYNDLPTNPLVEPGTMSIVIILYTVTCLMGMFGNGLICLVVIRRPKMRTVINLFICNLALSDLVLCSFGAPLTLVAMLSSSWTLGLAPCRIYSMITACMVFVSSLTFTAVAIDRFCLVVYPFLRPIDKVKCIVAIVIIWIIAIAMTLPIALQSYIIDLAEIYNTTTHTIVCIEIWDYLENRKKYTIALFVVQFAYPLLLVSIAHASIAIKLMRNVKPGARSRDNDAMENRRRRRTNRMLSAVVTVFAVSWLPFNVVSLIQELGEGDPPSHFTGAAVYLLAVSSTWLNPLLYAWLNDNFRKEFHRMMPCIPCLKETRNVGCVKPSQPGASTTNFMIDKRSQPSMATYLQPTSVEKSSSGKSGEHDTTM
ncbi:neuropeptide F receptor-like [Asterias amurensis]|uniref:neuropeptide F receptor-like n=1 Tax=Asterias amurensis TaxID=7602 RepID=UPI003AB7A665